MSEKKEKLHQFKQGLDIGQAASGIGEASVQSVRNQIEDSDENYQAGVEESKKYAMPAMDAAAILGARELSKGIRADLNQVQITGGQVYGLVREGALSMLDLSDQKRLKERLENVEQLSSFQKNQILRHRETVYDAILVKDAIEQQKDLVKGLEEHLLEHLHSTEFFDLTQERTNELLNTYFKRSQNDVLSQVNPAQMSQKKLQKLLKTKDRNGFSEIDAAAIRLAGRQTRYRESRIHAGRLLNISKRVERLRTYSYRVDSTAGSGLIQIANTAQVIHAAYAVGKFGLKAGAVSASFVGKYTGAAYLLQRLNQLRIGKQELLKRKASEAAKKSRMYQSVTEKAEILKIEIEDTKKQVDKRLKQNAGVQKYKKAQETTRQKAKEVRKKTKQVKAAAKAAQRTTRQGYDRLLSPVRLVGKGVDGIRRILSGFRLALLASAGVVIAVFLIMIVLVNGILNLFQTEANVALSAIMTSDECFIMDMTSRLRELQNQRLREAEILAEELAEENETESMIVYQDGRGNGILNGMNNIKDCIIMAYVIMDGDFDSDERARDDLITDLWELMNPEVTSLDTTVYLTVKSMDEMFDTGVLPPRAGKAYEAYIDCFGGWTDDNIEWARLLDGSDWYELYGIDPAGGTGYAAGGGMTAEEITALLESYGDLDSTRAAICSDAMSFVGQIPYYWGGKARAKEYDANGFWETVKPDYKGRNKRGLDCSGFVQWIIWRVTNVKFGASTSTITAGMQQISATELKPGDLGLMTVPGSKTNHVGIFVGYNDKGQALWCHENSGAGNVCVNDTTCFRYYYRLF